MVQLAAQTPSFLEIPSLALNSLLGLLLANPHPSHILVLQKSLSSRLNALTPFSALKQRGHISSALWLEDSLPPLADISYVILCESSAKNASLVAERVREIHTANSASSVCGIIVDDITPAFSFRLEQLGVSGDIRLFPWSLPPTLLDNDLLSLEETPRYIMQSLYLRGLEDSLFKVAKKLLLLTEQFPSSLVFDRIIAKGDKATRVVHMYDALRRELLSALNPLERREHLRRDRATEAARSRSQGTCDLIVLERGDDFVTPMLSQLTYLGLVDETYNLQSNSLDAGGEIGRVVFDFENDEILKAIKDQNFASVGPILNKYAKTLQSEIDARHSFKKIAQVKEFVGKLSSIQQSQHNLNCHTFLAEGILSKAKGSDADEEQGLFSKVLEIQQNLVDGYYDVKKVTEYIIDLIAAHGLDLFRALRLCCLFSLVNKGVPEKHYKHLKEELVLSFGIRHVLTLQNLKKLRLFFPKEPTLYLIPKTELDTREDSILRDYASLKSYLNLAPENDEKDPSFAFPGYVPISARLVQSAYDRSFVTQSYLSKAPKYLSNCASWKGLEDLWKNLQGATLERGETKGTESKEEALTLVVIVGGVTYGELATYRWIQDSLKSKGINRKFVFMVDCILNGDELLNGCVVESEDDC